MKLTRVNKKNPCTACGHDSWCLLGTDAALCMRLTSDRPYTMSDGSVGYWHSFDGAAPKRIPQRSEPFRPKVDFRAMMLGWRIGWDRENHNLILDLSSDLGVRPSSITVLSVGWAPEFKAYAFPMRDAFGNVIGIRLRNRHGDKWSVTGSQQGLFIPRTHVQNNVYVCEGPTDCAALVSMGKFAVGRPSCTGGVLLLKQLLKRLGSRKMIVIADNDQDKFVDGRKYNPGMDGAVSLVRQIPIESCIVTLPTKDVREFFRLGGTPADLESLERNAIVENAGRR